MRKLFLFLLLIMLTIPCFAQFKYASYMVNGYSLPYQVMFPENYDESKQYPLLLFLHGAGERGSDNENQLIYGKQFLIDNFHANYPAIVIAPQCPSDSYWSNVERHQIDTIMNFNFDVADDSTQPMKTLTSLISWWISSGKVDTDNIYVGGLSMGGMGTFELLWRMPETFAAAFPICGGSSLKKMDKYAKNTAVWIFHGSEDNVVNPDFSREAYKKLKELGCNVKYTEYEGVNHGSWHNVFMEKDLAQWLFER